MLIENIMPKNAKDKILKIYISAQKLNYLLLFNALATLKIYKVFPNNPDNVVIVLFENSKCHEIISRPN